MLLVPLPWPLAARAQHQHWDRLSTACAGPPASTPSSRPSLGSLFSCFSPNASPGPPNGWSGEGGISRVLSGDSRMQHLIPVSSACELSFGVW